MNDYEIHNQKVLGKSKESNGYFTFLFVSPSIYDEMVKLKFDTRNILITLPTKFTS